MPSYEHETKATLFILRSLLDSHVVMLVWGQEMHIKISWYLLRIWHNDDDGNSKADQCHGQLQCTSLIATLRPTNGSFASLFASIVTTCVGQRIGNSPGD